MRIAIYGGSFNPIHNGHTSLAQTLLQQNLVDEVWLMVSPQNPLKASQQPGIYDATYSDRLAMAHIACRDIEGVVVSDFESHLPIPSYTITTLTELSQQFPQHQFSLVIGADNWQRFDHWYKADEILHNYPIFVYRRPGYDIDIPECSLLRVKIVETPLYDVSSTEIRNGLKTDQIHPDVLEYIKTHHLYF